MGGMGGAQPLAATMNGAAFLGVEVDPARLQRRIDTGYLDTMTRNLDEAWTLVTSARDERRPLSVGLVGNCADVLPEMVRRGWIADVLTDQTSAHDPLNGYVPRGLTLEKAAGLSVGRRFREIRATSRSRTIWCWSCSPKTKC